MWKYNKYNIGDIVTHKENLQIDFEIVDVLGSEPEKREDYVYACKIINGRSKQIPQGWATVEEVVEDINNPHRPLSERIFKYAENKLRLIKKAAQ